MSAEQDPAFPNSKKGGVVVTRALNFQGFGITSWGRFQVLVLIELRSSREIHSYRANYNAASHLWNCSFQFLLSSIFVNIGKVGSE